MILEGVVTTIAADGRLNVAPMGPTVNDSATIAWETFELRPFKTSQTYMNLRATGEGVLHVTDDVRIIALAVAGSPQPPTVASRFVRCPRLADCCRFYEFRVEAWDDKEERTRLTARVVHGERVRDFFGFNRAKHAVVEAAILASRVGILPNEEILEELRRLRSPVDKTGSDAEKSAFDFLVHHVENRMATVSRESA